MPEDQLRHASLVDQNEPSRPKLVRAKHAASLIVVRIGQAGPAQVGDPVAEVGTAPGASTDGSDEPWMLMGMRGAKHRFMPNRLVFPGGRVEPADLAAASASPLTAAAERGLRKHANAKLARGLAMAAARELLEETGLSLGAPPRLDKLHYLARAVTPPSSPIRFNARFLVVEAAYVSGQLGGDGELDALRFYSMTEALALDLALPTRRILERLRIWLTMTDTERDAETATPVLLRDRGWRME